jgi:protoheme IX farnesyltransferase
MTRAALPVTPVVSQFRWLALTTSAVVAGMLVFGGLVRVNTLTPGCVGHWPLCNGEWFPPLEQPDWFEIAYRAAAGVAIALVAALAFSAWLGYRRVRWILWPSLLSLGLLAFTLLLGAVKLPAALSVAVAVLNYVLALVLLALALVATVVAFQLHKDARLGDSLFHFDSVSRLTGVSLLAVGGLLVMGTLVTAMGARAACPDWPLCDASRALWPATLEGVLSMGHRLAALVAGILVFGSVVMVWRLRHADTILVVTATTVGCLFLGQVMIGAANVFDGFPLRLNGIHVVTSVAIWIGTVVLAVLALQYVRLSPLKFIIPARRPHSLRPALADYVALTKPIIMALLLTTTAAAMVMAGRDWPPLILFFWTMLGGGLAAGGASALNQVIDRDLDKSMTRTARRPLAQGRLTFAEGLSFGVALTIAAFYVLAVYVNLAAAFWAMVGSAYYVLGYSLLLKKRTSQNIVIGGGAGAIPPLVGWAAVTGGVSMPAWFLFALVFFWTPPHFWALSLLKKNDYARAGVPMLPVVWGEGETRRHILLYSLLLLALSLLFTPAGVAGLVYFLSAGVLGVVFLTYALRLWRAPSNATAWQMYKYSSLYLALIFGALVVDRFFFFGV